MIKLTKPPKLQTQLYLAYLGILLLFLGAFSIFFYTFFSNKLTEEGLDNLYNNTLSLKDSVEASMNDMDTVSININYSSIIQNTLSYNFNLDQSENSYKALADLFVVINGTDSRVDYIYLYDLNGNRLQVDSVQKLSHIEIESQPWYEPVLEHSGAPYISPPYSKKVAGYTSDVISLYRTYTDTNQQTVGIIETVKNCKSLFSSIIRFEKNSISPTRIYIYNDNGEMIYPYKQDAANLNYPDIQNIQKTTSLNQARVQKVVNPLTQNKEYLTPLRSSYTGWTYYGVQDESVMLAPLHQLIRTLLLFIAFLIVCALIISHYLSKRLVHPIAHLKHIIQRMQFSTLGAESPDSYPVFSIELKELYDSFAEMNVKLKGSRDQLIKLQEAELEARSLALQSQMSPHFYYNSLSSIMILAENGDTKSVTGMCQNLSGIMRYVTDFKTRIVSIREELHYIKEYLFCMKIRNQSSLHHEIHVDPALLDIKIPKLCIHPLVENALKYGTNCDPPWAVKIYSECTDTYWKIYVEDEGSGFTEESLQRLNEHLQAINASPAELSKLQINGLGLANIYIRLSIYFENHFIFEYGNTKDGHAFAAIGAFHQKED